VSKANNPLYSGIDLKKLPLETLYGTMRLLRLLEPRGLKNKIARGDPGPDLPMWDTKTWREVQRRSKLPDCEKGENQ